MICGHCDCMAGLGEDIAAIQLMFKQESLCHAHQCHAPAFSAIDFSDPERSKLYIVNLLDKFHNCRHSISQYSY